MDGRTNTSNSLAFGVLMSNKKEVFNECYMCEEMYIDILDLINHIKAQHKNETGTQ